MVEVSEIVEAVDMEEYISQYCDFEERGGELWALSPFKEENTPSFSVNTEKGFWYDFSSGLGGNLIDFVMKYHDVNLPKAVNILKQYAGIDDSGETVGERLSASKVARKYRCTKKNRNVATSKELRQNIMSRYEFRKDKLKLWADEGISWDAMKHFLVMYNSFDDRIVYPVRDMEGKIISICGRTCDPDFKKKKIRKYTYYQEIGTVDTLYGFSDNADDIMREREIILFEGAKSVMMAWGWGIRNTSAILTSHLSDNLFDYLVKLASFHGIGIVFALDSDVDIEKDANICRLCSYARVEWIWNYGNLLNAKDSPVDRGKEIFDKLYKERRRLSFSHTIR